MNYLMTIGYYPAGGEMEKVAKECSCRELKESDLEKLPDDVNRVFFDLLLIFLRGSPQEHQEYGTRVGNCIRRHPNVKFSVMLYGDGGRKKFMETSGLEPPEKQTNYMFEEHL